MAAPAIPVAQGVDRRASRGLWGDAARRLLRNKPALVGLCFIALFVIAAVFAPILAPYGPLEGGLASWAPIHRVATSTAGCCSEPR